MTHPIAIVSGSARQDIAAAINDMKINSLVRFFLGCEDYFPGKPHPAGFTMAAEQLAVPPENCLVFEDSSPGVRAAKAARMSCIALQRPGRPPQDLSAADRIVTDLSDCLHNGLIRVGNR